MEKQWIIDACKKQLLKLSLIDSVEIASEINLNDIRHDARLAIGVAKQIYSYGVTVRKVLKQPLPSMLHHQKNDSLPTLLFAEYVNPSIADELKESGIQFVDTAGNLFLYSGSQLYLYIKGNKRKASIESVSSVYQPKGMQVLFALLSHPGLLNQPLREIKEIAGVSYGQTQACMKELKSKGLIFKDQNGQIRFTHKKQIFEKWVSNYGDRLRPKLVLNSFKVMPSVFDQVPRILTEKVVATRGTWALSGGFGSNILDPYYLGPHIALFIRPELVEEVKQQLNLIPAKETNITLLKLFTPDVVCQDCKEPPFAAHPLLIYAELLYQGGYGTREEETAQRIYQKYLKTEFNGTES